MADDPHNTSTSDVSELVPDNTEPSAANVKEDAETTAARRELKQTTISDKAKRDSAQLSQEDDKSASEEDDNKSDAGEPEKKKPRTSRGLTPEVQLAAPKQEVPKETVASPKKRTHDELEQDGKEEEEKKEGEKPSSQNRAERDEPEKKRPRDRQASLSVERDGQKEVEPLSAQESRPSSAEKPKIEEKKDESKDTKVDKPQTSSSAFANSSMAKFASSTTSPFGAFGAAAAGKTNLFGLPATSSNIFGSKSADASAAPAGPPKLSFGSASAASPFASLNGQAGGMSSLFKSPFASAFSGGSSALKTAGATGFGKPGEPLKTGKSAKPFGAPESDEEDEGEGEEGEENKSENGEGEEKEEEEKEEKASGEEKKKFKLQKVHIDDGEGNETTLLSVRAKMYVMEKGVGWKERGAGMLKVNVPKQAVEVEEGNQPDADSFDPAALDDAARKLVRLIMRQDSTLRVILNTPILPAMKFQVNHKLKAATVLFTAFEGGEARQVQMKMSQANATQFSNMVEKIKEKLAAA